jgi:hypothetical protein
MGVGRSEASSIIGINQKQFESLLFQAKINMYRAFPIGKSEFYDNFIVDINTTYYPFAKKSIVTVRADIVTQEVTYDNQAFSSTYQKYLGDSPSLQGLHLSDSVVILNGNSILKGILVDIQENKSATVMITSKGREIFKKESGKSLFALDNEDLEEQTGYEAGQILQITSSSKEEPEIRKVEGLQQGRILLSVKQGKKIKYIVQNLEK